jgi:threonine/homoserine/homoserine lactone efflux protein
MYGYGPWGYRQRMGCRAGSCVIGCMTGALLVMLLVIVGFVVLLSAAPPSR